MKYRIPTIFLLLLVFCSCEKPSAEMKFKSVEVVGDEIHVSFFADIKGSYEFSNFILTYNTKGSITADEKTIFFPWTGNPKSLMYAELDKLSNGEIYEIQVKGNSQDVIFSEKREILFDGYGCLPEVNQFVFGEHHSGLFMNLFYSTSTTEGNGESLWLRDNFSHDYKWNFIFNGPIVHGKYETTIEGTSPNTVIVGLIDDVPGQTNHFMHYKLKPGQNIYVSDDPTAEHFFPKTLVTFCDLEYGDSLFCSGSFNIDD